MAYQLQEINRRIKTDVTEFLEECDQRMPSGCPWPQTAS